MDPGIVLEVLEALVTPGQAPLPKVETSDTPTEATGFDNILATNLESFHSKLDASKYQEIKSSLTQALENVPDCDQSIRWKYAATCLCLLNILRESMESALAEFEKQQKGEQLPRSPHRAPPLSPDVLSIRQQKTVAAVMQFIVCLGVCPYLQAGVGIPLERRSGFGQLLTLTAPSSSLLKPLAKNYHLLYVIKILLSCTKNSSLGTPILSRHLGDLLAVLCQIAFQPFKKVVKGAPVMSVEKGQPLHGESALQPTTSTASTGDTGTAVRKKTNSAKSVEDVTERDLPSGDAGTKNADSADSERSGNSMSERNLLLDDAGIKQVKSEKSGNGTSEKETLLVDGVVKAPIECKLVESAEASESGLTNRSELLKMRDAEHAVKTSGEGEHERGKEPELGDQASSSPNKSQQSKPEDSTGGSRTVQQVAPQRSVSAVDKEWCQGELRSLLERVYQPMAIRELLVLQAGGGGSGPRPGVKMAGSASGTARAPVWLRKVCGQLLSERLTAPKGVQNVIQGILEGTSGGVKDNSMADWRKCQSVAAIIANCPVQMASVEDYYRLVAPQVLELVHFPDAIQSGQFLRVACCIIIAMLRQHPQQAQVYVINPLLQALLTASHNNEVVLTRESCVVVSESELAGCVEDLHRVFAVGSEPDELLVAAIRPVSHILFHLYFFSKTAVTGNISSACLAILKRLLKHSDRQVTLTLLHLLVYDQLKRETGNLLKEVLLLNPCVKFSCGPSGDVAMVTRTHEDDPEVEALMNLEQKCGAIVDLLEGLRDDGTAGDFFILVLKELTCVISSKKVEDEEEEEEEKGGNPIGQDLFDIEKQQAKGVAVFQRNMMTLTLLASMCESLGHECLKSTHHILDFIKATLERGVEIIKDPGKESELGSFESETLTMAMGLLTSIVGGAILTNDSEKKKMKDLLPLLQEVANNHSTPNVKAMAANIRVAIATHGAVWEDPSAKREKVVKESKKDKTPKVKKEQKSKPLIEVLPDPVEICVKGAESKAKIKPKCSGGIKIEEKDKGVRVNDVIESKAKINPKCSVEIKTEGRDKKQERLDIGIQGDKKEDNTNESEISEFQQAMRDVLDPLLPIKGHAFIALAKLIRTKDTAAMEDQETLRELFSSNLEHEDSYIYLTAIQGLVALADVNADAVVPILAAQFAELGSQPTKCTRTSEVRMKLGEALVKASRCLGDMIPRYRDTLLNAFLVGTRDPDAFLRASSLSNIAEICKLLKYSLGPIIHEVLECSSSILRTDPEVEARRAAAHILRSLLQGLGKDALQVLESVLRDIYRLLKQTAITDKDDVIQLHVQLALEEMDVFMREYLFPKQTLTKKIRVLDPN